MSSEYSTHLGDRLIRSQVDPLDDLACTTIKINLDAKNGAWASNEQIVFYAGDDRLLEMSLLFHKIAQDLAALLPDVAACCRCVPGTPDDQCAEHGYGAFKIKERSRVMPEQTVREQLVGALQQLTDVVAERPDIGPAYDDGIRALDRHRAEPEYVCCDDHSDCPCYQEGLEAQRRPLGC